MFNENYPFSIEYGDSVIKRRNFNLKGPRLAKDEVIARLPGLNKGSDLLVSGPGDVTILGMLREDAIVSRAVRLVALRALIEEILDTLPPGFILMKRDGVIENPYLDDGAGTSLFSLTMLNRRALKRFREDKHFWGARCGKQALVGDVQISSLENVFDCICYRFQRNRVFSLERFRGDDLGVAGPRFLSFYGGQRRFGLTVGNSLRMGTSYMDTVWLMDRGERVSWTSGGMEQELFVTRVPSIPNEKPILKFIPGCNTFLNQCFWSAGNEIQGAARKAFAGDPLRGRVINAHVSVSTWAPTVSKLRWSMDMIKAELSASGACLADGIHQRPWVSMSMFPGLVGELPDGVSFHALSKAAARYVA